MADPLPIVLVPGLGCSARLYRDQVAALWPLGPIMVADHRRDDIIEAIAGRIFANAPPRFALAGLSMGGFIAFAMMRLAPERIARLALLDTNARADVPERSVEREKFIAMAQAGRFAEVCDILTPRYLHPSRLRDQALVQVVRDMADDTGVEAFVRQQRAIMGRPDSRPLLATIRCPTLVLVGDSDAATPPALSEEIANGISGARLVVVGDCGHLSTLERPDEVNAALAEWLGA
jgi:pimeloyl-ACP methyl ester carboxylesterase